MKVRLASGGTEINPRNTACNLSYYISRTAGQFINEKSMKIDPEIYRPFIQRNRSIIMPDYRLFTSFKTTQKAM